MVERGRKRLGFLGGSFDPVHHGHLLAALDAQEALNLDRVFLVPAQQNPLKGDAPVASAEDRVAMLTLALQSWPDAGIFDWELSQQGRSYTIHTVRAIRAQWPEAALWWITGGDQIAQLDRWKDIQELASMLRFAAVRRPGSPEIQAGEWPVDVVEGHSLKCSSSELRMRLAKGRPIHFFVPQAVAAFIASNRLYQSTVESEAIT